MAKGSYASGVVVFRRSCPSKQRARLGDSTKCLFCRDRPPMEPHHYVPTLGAERAETRFVGPCWLQRQGPPWRHEQRPPALWGPNSVLTYSVITGQPQPLPMYHVMCVSRFLHLSLSLSLFYFFACPGSRTFPSSLASNSVLYMFYRIEGTLPLSFLMQKPCRNTSLPRPSGQSSNPQIRQTQSH